MIGMSRLTLRTGELFALRRGSVGAPTGGLRGLMLASLLIGIGFSGCAATTGLSNDDAAQEQTHDGTAPGRSFGCGAARADGGGSATCVVGQSYCSIYEPQQLVPTPQPGACVTLSGTLAACVENPTCACVLANISCAGVPSCSESDGAITVACMQV